MPDPFKQVKIIELMELFDDDEVTTADQVDRPQKALDREMFQTAFRQQKAGGGMLVEPGFGGVRQGYSEASEKVINFAKQFKEKNKDLPTQQEIMKGTGAGSSTIKRHLKEGVDFKKVLSPRETSAIAGKKSAEKKKIESGVIAPDDKEGLKKLQTKVNKLNRVNNLKNKGIKFNIVPTQAGNFTTELSYLAETYRNKLNKTKSTGPLKNLIEEFNQFRKTDLFKKYDKGTVMREAGIKSAKKQLENIGSKKLEVFDYLLNNKNATIEEIGEALKMSQGSVKKNLQGLYTDVYKRVADQGAVFLKDYNINQLDSVHDSIKNTKVPLKDRVKNLVIDAYKGDENLKPILKKLDDFYALQSEIKKTPYGKFFAANLDHVVPLNFLRELEKGVSPMDLIRVRPIPEFLNQRAFKAQFDRVLGQAYATKNKKALEAIVNLQSYLPKEFGGITPEGKIIDYGAKPFSLKTNLSQAEFPEIYKRVFEFIKNPDLQDTFKEAKVSFKNLLSQEKNIIKQSQSIDSLMLKLSAQIDRNCANSIKQASKDGGRIGLKAIGSREVCLTKAKNYMTEELKKGIGTEPNARTSLIKRIIVGTGNFLKQNLSPKELLKAENLIGKPALYGALAFETAYIGDSIIRKGQPLNVATAESLVGDILDLDANVARAKNLLKSNVQISPAAKQYAQNIIDYDTFQKNQLGPVQSAIAKKLPGSDKYFKMQEDLKNKITQSSDAGRFDYEKAVDEIDATQMAREDYSPFFSKLGTPLKGRVIDRPGTRVGPRVMQRDFKMDLSPITYENFKPNIASKEQVDDFLKATKVIPEDRELLQEFYEKQFVKPAELEQLMESPSFRGTQFAGGGIAKEAGDPSGAMLESMNPDSQGLSGLLKRGNKI
jgi:hypothetical protein